MWKANALPRPVLVGIRREDRTRIWERRAPLTPDAVHNLISSAPPCNGRNGVQVEIVGCSKRVFTDSDYERAGARIVPQLSNPNFILGIKEPPIAELDQLHRSLSHNPDAQPEAPTHVMFSHTIKGQQYNMPLLSRFLGSSSPGPSERHRVYPTLIDYELLADQNGKRTVGFGWFAGAAGVPEAFSAMAQSHLEQGVASPFLYIARPYTNRTLEEMQKNLQLVGSIIRSQGLPDELGPFVIGLTGSGNVSQGVLDMLKELPLTKIKVGALQGLMENQQYNKHTIYLVHVNPQDYLFRDDGHTFNKPQYYESPERYKSLFHERIAPYLTLFINGVGWGPKFPRLMTNNQLLATTHKASSFPGFRFMNVADISCDINGGLEFLSKATTLSSPFYDIPLSQGGPLRMMTVDILPSAIPIDASKHFSDVLLPYLTTLIEEFSFGGNVTRSPSPVLASDGKESGNNGDEGCRSLLSSALKRATVAKGGELMDDHKWLRKLVEPHIVDFDNIQPLRVGASVSETQLAFTRMSSSVADGQSLIKKRVLLLGSGMVAQPVVDYLVCKGGTEVTIASNNPHELKSLEMPYINGSVEAICLDLGDPKNYEPLVVGADVVISLLPAHMHHVVAEVCITAGKPLVTASYTSPEMAELNLRAKQRGVLILTEMGLDPGLDHLSAVNLIDKLKQARRSLVSFTSMCGGLPAPEDALGVPLKYKFNWRPEGVLLAALQNARYTLLGNIYAVKGFDLLKSGWGKLPIKRGIELEGLPNRDSLHYMKLYRLGGMRTFVRGTLRYPGYSTLLNSFKKLGLLNAKKKILPEGWNAFILESMLAEYNMEDRSIPSLVDVIEAESLQALHEALEWLGLSSDLFDKAQPRRPMPPLPLVPDTPLSIFAYLLSHKLRYQATDKDMVILSHEIISTDFYLRFGPEKAHTSTLVAYGTDQMHVGFHGERPASAMARTVGFPAAIAAMLIVQGKLDGLVGVKMPSEMEICRPVLRELEEMGISFEEKTRDVGLRDNPGAGTVESALASAVKGVPEEKRQKLESGQGDHAWILDLDADKGWEEENFVEWSEKETKTG